MTHYFAFPASDTLRDSSQELLNNINQNVREPQNTLAVKVSRLFVDEIVDALLLSIVRAADTEHSGAKILEQFAGLIKSTVHSLIKMVVGKMSNDDLKPMASYITNRRLTLIKNSITHDFVVFSISPEFYERFRAVLTQGAAGEKNSAELLACMEIFSDLSHDAFYEEPLRQIKLGFVGRKVADMGGAAMRSGSRSASRRLIPELSGAELKQFCAYFLSLLIVE